MKGSDLSLNLLDDERLSGDELEQDANSIINGARDANRLAKRLNKIGNTTSGRHTASGGGAVSSGGAAASGGTAAASGGTAAASGGTAAASGGTAAASGGTAAASGGTAAASGGTAAASGGTAAAAGGWVVLVIIAVIAVAFVLLTLQAVLAAVWSNVTMHINDPDQLSSEEDIFEYGSYEENAAAMKAKSEELNQYIDYARDAAIQNALLELRTDAIVHGWIVHYQYVDVTRTVRDLHPEQIYVNLYAGYSASMHNFLSDYAFSYFQSISSVADMTYKLKEDIWTTDVPNRYKDAFPFGNYMYGADYQRDSNGNVIVHKIGDFYYVYAKVCFTDFKSVYKHAFDINNLNAPYDPDVSDSTYKEVIEFMCEPLYEILYPRFASELPHPNTGDTSNWFNDIISQTNPTAPLPLNGATAFVDIALSQSGQTGGLPYCIWYGYHGRVEWCAIFASWCAEQSSDVNFARFSSCKVGIDYLKSKGLFVSKTQIKTYTPKSGDLIFFDWAPCDATVDHVGIVVKVQNGRVYTVEGNSGDYPGVVATKSYDISDIRIAGYGKTGN